MESRKILVVSTVDQNSWEVETGAETLGELKDELSELGVTTNGCEFQEGLTHTTMTEDSALLPKDIMRNGKVTNNLIFALVKPNKDIKNGYDRKECYQYIKEGGLSDEFKAAYSKVYTCAKTSELNHFLATHSINDTPSTESSCDETPCECPSNLKDLNFSSIAQKIADNTNTIEKCCAELIDLYNTIAVKIVEATEEPTKSSNISSVYTNEEVAEILNRR